jgi:hypothetical protein
MREKIVDTLIKQYEAKIHEHQLNINIMISNPIAIPEHEGFVSAIDKELGLLSEAKDKLEALKEYF